MPAGTRPGCIQVAHGHGRRPRSFIVLAILSVIVLLLGAPLEGREWLADEPQARLCCLLFAMAWQRPINGPCWPHPPCQARLCVSFKLQSSLYPGPCTLEASLPVREHVRCSLHFAPCTPYPLKPSLYPVPSNKPVPSKNPLCTPFPVPCTLNPS